MRHWFRTGLTGVSLFVLATTCLPVSASLDDSVKARGLVDSARVTLDNMLSDSRNTWFQDKLKDAKAILIVPQMLKGGFIFGGAGGSGVMLKRDDATGQWSYPAFYTMGSVTFGLQIGAQAAGVVLLVMTDRAVDAFMSNKVQLGGDLSIAAGPIGGGAQAATIDVYAFSRSKGAFVGATLEGSVITVRNSLNEAYYNQSVRPVNILITHTVVNRQADPLRQSLAKAGQPIPVAMSPEPPAAPAEGVSVTPSSVPASGTAVAQPQ
ncbi:MAG: lipid-binding SYLF domain-containing protein [Pseudomonadota bacterium]|nr:lipid-binding SYLF domain-containing protein [Pseudomonadota bacterium]